MSERGVDRLAVVLSNPPTTSGLRTLNRVSQASTILGASEIAIVNLFPIATYRTTDISARGLHPDTWHSARPEIEHALGGADAALLAYGARLPVGPARVLCRDQIAWLHMHLLRSGIPAYVIGDAPRHPSRWQRYTARQFAGLPFPEALRRSISTWDLQPM